MTDPQAKAVITWCATPDPEHAILQAIPSPRLWSTAATTPCCRRTTPTQCSGELSNAYLSSIPIQDTAPCSSTTRSSSATFGPSCKRDGGFVILGAVRRGRVPYIHESCCGGQNDNNRESRGGTFQLDEFQTIRRCCGRAEVSGRATRHGRIFQGDEGGKFLPYLERVVKSGLGRTDLMLFAEFDLGAILRRETGSRLPRPRDLWWEIHSS